MSVYETTLRLAGEILKGAAILKEEADKSIPNGFDAYRTVTYSLVYAAVFHACTEKGIKDPATILGVAYEGGKAFALALDAELGV